MAEKRMITKSILNDNDFLNLDNTTKILFIYLVANADDDGFVQRSIMIDRVINADDSNYEALEKINYLISIDREGMLEVITQWNIMQTLRGDAYVPTRYLQQRSKLFLRKDFSYTLDEQDPNIFSTVDFWCEVGRPKRIANFTPYLNELHHSGKTQANLRKAKQSLRNQKYSHSE